MNAPRSLFAGLCAVALCLQASTLAAQSGTAEETGDPIERARAHFRLGVDFYREQNYRAALIEFQRAYAASPHYKLLYNLGQASLELHEDSNGIDYFTRYLQEAGAELSDERKVEVEENIVRLRARLATVTITVSADQAGAEIYVDETRIGSAPLGEPVKVSAGRRRFVAKKLGMPDAERVIDVAAGDQVSVELEFKERPQVDLANLQKALDQQEASGAPAALYTGIATGLIGAGAVTMSILTMLAQQNYDDELKNETSSSELERLREDANTKALVADILWGATIAAAGTTLVLMLVDGGDEEEKPLVLGVSPGGVRVSGRF